MNIAPLGLRARVSAIRGAVTFEDIASAAAFAMIVAAGLWVGCRHCSREFTPSPSNSTLCARCARID